MKNSYFHFAFNRMLVARNWGTLKGGESLLTLLILTLFSHRSDAQSITEKIIRQSPRLSWSAGLTYDTNFQSPTTYENQQGMLTRITPRYRINDKLTLLASAGATQRFTQENRSDLTNASISLSRNPFAIGNVGDLRVTTTIVAPTNEISRDKESLLTSYRLGANFFVRTNTNFIWEMGGFATVNNHRYSVSAFNQPNIQYRLTPYGNIGWTFKERWQLMFYTDYTRAYTYRGNERGFFTLDESLTYIGGRRWSATIGVSNGGSVVAKDGQSSNIAFFNTRTTTTYINGTFNY